ncbi:MAG: hypothetical protein ACK559_39065, partial [bacterium]
RFLNFRTTKSPLKRMSSQATMRILMTEDSLRYMMQTQQQDSLMMMQRGREQRPLVTAAMMS